MKEKIVYLMKSNDLTTTRFAELLEIQPSTISHLVSGRNKPGYDLLQKILRAFPSINPDWLLLDSDEPYRKDAATPLPDSLDLEGESLHSHMTGDGDVNLFSAVANRAKNEFIQPQVELNQPQKKSIKSPIFVVVFYDDGSCENFSMRK